MPYIFLCIWLSKLNSTPTQANLSNYSNTYFLRCGGASPLLNSSFTHNSILSTMGMLVNNGLISKEHTLILSRFIFSFTISSAKLKESLTLYFEKWCSNGFNVLTHHLASLCCGELIIDSTGLSSTSTLWTLGKT